MTLADAPLFTPPPAPEPGKMTAAIHWLAFTTRIGLDDVLQALVDHVCLQPGHEVEGVFVAAAHGGKGYHTMLMGPHKMLVFHSVNSGRSDIHVIVPGTACEYAGSANVLRLFELAIKPTRIDVALDGLVKLDGTAVRPLDLYTLCRYCPDQVRTKCNIRVDESLPPEERTKSICHHTNPQGDTCEIGSRTSERYARVYDRRGFCRFELEIKGDKAEALGEILDGKKPSKLPGLIVGLIARFIAFVEEGDDSNKSRGDLQDWWAAIVASADDVELTVPTREACISRTWNWIKTSVSGSLLAVVKAAMAGGQEDAYTILHQLLNEGERVFTGRHKLLVAGAKGWTPT